MFGREYWATPPQDVQGGWRTLPPFVLWTRDAPLQDRHMEPGRSRADRDPAEIVRSRWLGHDIYRICDSDGGDVVHLVENGERSRRATLSRSTATLVLLVNLSPHLFISLRLWASPKFYTNGCGIHTSTGSQITLKEPRVKKLRILLKKNGGEMIIEMKGDSKAPDVDFGTCIYQLLRYIKGEGQGSRSGVFR